MRMMIAWLCLVTACLFPLKGFADPDANAQKPQSDYEQLKKDYEAVVADRDNLRAQAKVLLEYKNEIKIAQQNLTMIENERKQWELEKKSFANQFSKIEKENDLLVEKISVLQAEQMELAKERDDLRKTLSQSKAGYIVIDELNNKVKEQRKEISILQSRIDRLSKEAQVMQDNMAKAEAAEHVLKTQVKDINSKYRKALAQNKALERKIERQPAQYAEIARENKVLIKRTALMHYNLGVFYSQNKEYNRAVAEFEKSIELNPEDAQSYFNLGYIYAEQFVDRPKAIDNFQKYLRLAKKDDADIDWVKKYILTWQTWEGKAAAK